MPCHHETDLAATVKPSYGFPPICPQQAVNQNARILHVAVRRCREFYLWDAVELELRAPSAA